MHHDSTQLSTAVEVLWWLVFFVMLGLCFGSFLNAIIYRLPRDISLRRPLWSFCPACRARIAWYDNLPLISYLRLGGRCRSCHAQISARYPIVEILGALVILLIFDAFFIAHTHVGVGRASGTTWQLTEDWPIFSAHVILFTALLAMSAIDVEHYWVDVRFTTLATIFGFALHAVWTPARDSQWHRPADATAVAALVVTAALIVTMVALRRIFRDEARGPDTALAPAPGPLPAPPVCRTEPTGSAEPAVATEASATPLADVGHDEAAPSGDVEAKDEAGEAHRPPSLPEDRNRLLTRQGWARAAVLVAAVCLVLATAGAWADAVGAAWHPSPGARWAPAIAFVLLMILVAGAGRRQTDRAIIEAIESERTAARATAALELVCLVPAVILGGITLYYGSSSAEAGLRFGRFMDLAPIGDWRPLTGLGTAAVGFVIGGGLGWAVRLIATFVWGKEAFGTGDIHMMSAAGCVAGWPVAVIGFVLCSMLALAGVVFMLPFKRARAIPLGPWLSVSALIVVLWYDPIIEARTIQNMIDVYRTLFVDSGYLTILP